jgi:hypothetical protein
VPPATGSLGGASPPVTGQSQPITGQSEPKHGPKAVEGVAEQQALSTVSLAKPGPDGVSTKIVAPTPCGIAAHETEGRRPAWEFQLVDEDPPTRF